MTAAEIARFDPTRITNYVSIPAEGAVLPLFVAVAALEMNVGFKALRRFIADVEAATAVEYAVMLAMVLIAVIAGVGAVGGQSGGMWGGIQQGLNAIGFGSAS